MRIVTRPFPILAGAFVHVRCNCSLVRIELKIIIRVNTHGSALQRIVTRDSEYHIGDN